MGQAKAKQSTPAKPFTARIVDQLASVKFAVAVVVVIALACVVGTLLPQGSEVAKYLAKNPLAADRMKLLGTLGLTNVFYSWWFIGLLCVLAASIATCSTRRFATMRRTTGYARVRALGSMLTHISMLLILAGGVMRGVWGEKGYLELYEGQTVAQFVENRGVKPLPFTVHLQKFEIETYEQKQDDQLFVRWQAKGRQAVLPVKLGVEQAFDDFKITVLQYIPDFAVDTQTREITSRSSKPNNPAILVAVNGPTYQNHRWLFAKFPEFDHGGTSPLQMVYAAKPAGGAIKSFKSTLRFDDRETTVEVNRPFSYRGYTFYQSGYNPNDPSYTSLQVVKDPGVPVVYAGFGLMIAGLFIVFYLNPWWDQRRKQA
jgi:cytochrome c biogenesis protein ResB